VPKGVIGNPVKSRGRLIRERSRRCNRGQKPTPPLVAIPGRPAIRMIRKPEDLPDNAEAGSKEREL